MGTIYQKESVELSGVKRFIFQRTNSSSQDLFNEYHQFFVQENSQRRTDGTHNLTGTLLSN